MRIGVWRIGGFMAGVSAAMLALSPAVSAVRSALEPLSLSKVSLKALGSIGSFTPVTSDDRLARAYAQAAATSRNHGFKFTPASGLTSGERSVTVLVRAPNGAKLSPPKVAPNVGIAPVSYNLGVTRGLQRFAASDSVGTHELDPVVTDLTQPGVKSFSIEKPRRFSTNMQVAPKSVAGVSPQTLANEKSYAVDLASSYSLTRNLDVRAGVRFSGPTNRLSPITDEAQDSQAVYVGTAFKF